MKALALFLAVALVACAGSDSPLAPTAPSSVIVVTDTAAKPAAPSDFAIVVDSTIDTRAYVTVSWTDNSGGTAYTDLFNLYNGLPNNIAVAAPGVTSMQTVLYALRQDDYYLRSRRYIYDWMIPGPRVYSEPVGPLTMFAPNVTIATAGKKRAK